jgi:hypothetical protein
MSGFMSLEVHVSDYQKAQRAFIMANDSKTYYGIFRDSISDILDISLGYMKDIVHFDTNRLHDALDWKYNSHTYKGEIYISDRTAWNSSANVRREPQKYGKYEENRGGGHAFMARTKREKTDKIAPAGLLSSVKRVRWP